jgi:formylglycine-generating enzyme required for sulfatase activity
MWCCCALLVNDAGPDGLTKNVHEWCADWYDAAYYSVAPSHNPLGPSTGVRRASRGGSWRHQIKIARVAARSSLPPAYQYSDYGFRCALSR